MRSDKDARAAARKAYKEARAAAKRGSIIHIFVIALLCCFSSAAHGGAISVQFSLKRALLLLQSTIQLFSSGSLEPVKSSLS